MEQFIGYTQMRLSVKPYAAGSVSVVENTRMYPSIERLISAAGLLERILDISFGNRIHNQSRNIQANSKRGMIHKATQPRLHGIWSL